MSRITFYSHRYHPSAGGVETSTTHLVNHLVARGHVVTVATTTPPGAQGYPTAPIVHAPTSRKLFRLFRQSEIIHFQGFAVWPMIIGLASRRPIVWAHHDHDMVCPKSIAWWNGPCTYSLLQCTRDLSRDHSWLAVARSQVMLGVRRLVARHRRIHHLTHSAFVTRHNHLARATTIGYGIGTPKGDRPVDEDSPKARILFIGRLIYEKGGDVLIRAMTDERLADVLLTFLGDGVEREPIERLAKELGVNSRVSFAGQVSQEIVQASLRDSQLLVVPSRWQEPFGIVAIEAMNASVPVVASNVGGLGEIVARGGLVVEADNAAALAEAISRALYDRRLRQVLIERGHRVAEEHQWATLTERYEVFYRSLAPTR